MKTISLTRRQILIPILAWWLLFIALSAYNFNAFQIQNIVGFLFLAIVPGLLTMLASRIRGLPFWGYTALTVAFSLSELMIMALIGNTFLPFAGISRPLDKLTLLLELYPLIAVLMAVVWLRIKEVKIELKKYFLLDNLRDYVLSFTPAIFVVLSVFGAISLNNGGSNIWTMAMLGGMGVYLIVLLCYARKTDESTIPTALFFMSLALLLMTDLRGWYITGHDIQSEYKVFELAKGAGIWNIASYRDAYNACLSITILPTVFSNLLSVSDPYIYKFFFQVFFAICPVLVYLIGNQWTNRRVSLLSAMYFIGFPTFFTDMPFLVRQEIAFLFFGLMLYLIFEPNLRLSLRRRLFMLMGIGVILSHYSTTYTILVIFGFAVISRPLFIKLISWLKKKPLFENSAITVPLQNRTTGKGKITFTMVAILFALSFVWTSIITQTSSGLTNVIQQTLSAVGQGFSGNNRSVDVTTLLSFSKPNQDQELQDYITQNVDPIRAAAPANDFYASSTYSQYSLTVLDAENTPTTQLGQFIQRFDINPATVMTIFGQLLAKLTEILVPLGMVYFLLRRSVIRYVDDELYLISFYCLVFIGLNVVLPVISTEYGIFRAMQQSMFVIAPIIVAGSIMLGNAFLGLIKPLKKYLTGEKLAMILGVAFFSYSTHFLPYLFGNTTAVLHLSNDGTYYDDYLIQANEVYGVDWLTNIVGSNTDAANGIRLEVQANRYNKFASLTSLSPYTDIMPAVIRKNSYVFLGPITTEKQRATVIFNADQVTYQYPLQFLGQNKDLIYNNGGSEVYL